MNDIQFNFTLFDYQVVFEEVNTNWFERLFTGKKNKYVYTIREVSRCSNRIYNLQDSGYFASREPEVWWDNATEPESLIISAKMRLNPQSDNVVFSSRDL